MSQIFQVLITRLFVGGFLCSVVLMLAGEGVGREVARICCACLMIILVLSPLQGVTLELGALWEESEFITQQAVDQSLEQSAEQQYQAITEQIGQLLESQLAQRGIICSAKVSYEAVGERQYQLIGVTLTADGWTVGQKDTAAEIVLENCGLVRESIIFDGRNA